MNKKFDISVFFLYDGYKVERGNDKFNTMNLLTLNKGEVCLIGGNLETDTIYPGRG